MQTVGGYLAIATSAAAVVAVGLTLYYILSLRAASRRRDDGTPRSYLVTTATGVQFTVQTHGQLSKTELKQVAVELLDDAIAQEKLNPYPAALDRVTEHARRDVREELDSRYDIGRGPSEDRITETHVTRTGEEGAPLLWRELRVWTVGSHAPPLQAFSDLHQLELDEILDNGQKAALDWVPLPTTDDCVRALVLFGDELKAGEQRTWRFGYSIPGIWNPLREGGRDVCYSDLTNSVQYERMSVDFVMPIEFEDPQATLTQPYTAASPEPKPDVPARTLTLGFSFDQPESAKYMWELRIRRLAAPDGPFAPGHDATAN